MVTIQSILFTVTASGPAAKLGVESVYEAIDGLVDRLSSEFDDAEIVIFSMHGMGANTSDVPSMVLLPELIVSPRV